MGPLKISAIPVKDNYGLSVTFCDGTECRNVFRPSGSHKYIPAPYFAASVKYPNQQKARAGFYQKPESLFADWDVETTIADFVNNPPAFTYIEIKPAKPKDMPPKFKSDYAAIVYLLKELKLTGIEVKNGAAIFTHTKGSFTFGVRDTNNDGLLSHAEVHEIEILYL